MPAPAPRIQQDSRKESTQQPIARVTTTRDVAPPSQEEGGDLAQVVARKAQLETQPPAPIAAKQATIDIREKKDPNAAIAVQLTSSQPGEEAAPRKAQQAKPVATPAPASMPSTPAPSPVGGAPKPTPAPSKGTSAPNETLTQPLAAPASSSNEGQGAAATPNQAQQAAPQPQPSPAPAGGTMPPVKKPPQQQSEEDLEKQRKDEEDSNFDFILLIVLLPAALLFDLFCMIPLVAETMGQLGLLSLRGLFWLMNIRPGRLIENLLKRILEQQSKGSGGPSIPLPKETGKLIRVVFEAVFAGMVTVRFVPVISEFSFATTIFLVVTFVLCKVEERVIRTTKQALKVAGAVGRVAAKLPIGPAAKVAGGALAAADDVVNQGAAPTQAVTQEMSGAAPGTSTPAQGGGLPASAAEKSFAPGADAAQAMAGTRGNAEQAGPLATGKPVYTGEEEPRVTSGLGRQPGEKERAGRRAGLEEKRSKTAEAAGRKPSVDVVQTDLASQFDEKKFTIVKKDGSGSQTSWSAPGRPSAEGAPRVGGGNTEEGGQA